jgi:hypothetical protein
MPAPTRISSRQVRYAAAAVGVALVAGVGGFMAGRADPPREQATSTTAPAQAAAAGHDHGGAALAAQEAVGPSTGVKIKRDWVTEDGNRFSIWVAFGPPAGGGTMCTVGGGSTGYSRGMVILLRSDPGNKKGRAPMLGTTGGRVAFSFGEYACTWNISNSSVKPFRPGESRSIIGLVEPVKDPRTRTLTLTVVRSGKPPYKLATIPYAAMFS